MSVCVLVVLFAILGGSWIWLEALEGFCLAFLPCSASVC